MLRFRGADGWHPLDIRRHPRARRSKLRIDVLARRPVLTLPPRANMRRAAGWVESHRGWIEEKLHALPRVESIGPGARIPYRGETLTVRHDPEAARRPVLSNGALIVGGAVEGLARRVVDWLRGEARRVLESETRALANRAGLKVDGISIGDAKSRWGSCSSSGRIRYSWRLILAPQPVLSATVAHEVAHVAHMNHGPEFHALVAELFTRDPAPERAWLRANGAALYNVGFSPGRSAGGVPESPGG